MEMNLFKIIHSSLSYLQVNYGEHKPFSPLIFSLCSYIINVPFFFPDRGPCRFLAIEKKTVWKRPNIVRRSSVWSIRYSCLFLAQS